MATLDWSQCPAVESIPGKVSGAWVFRDTRLPVATVIEKLTALPGCGGVLAGCCALATTTAQTKITVVRIQFPPSKAKGEEAAHRLPRELIVPQSPLRKRSEELGEPLRASG